mmetsp:Transcript_1887/g.5647  ORF Transcript_1887/g.5647 Transcript_1887/m.5647 type:complete len:702 (+) Transcript_1887:70-2175(+)
MEQDEELDVVSKLSGHGLNMLAQEVDASNRLLNLTPTPIWERPRNGKDRGKNRSWGAGYSVSPAIEAWAQRVRNADAELPARVVGVVGATSAGKSWLVGKLLDDDAPKPCRLEEQFDGMTLQSMTSDINLYTDTNNEVYYLDFEGTYGTQPLHLGAAGLSSVMERCMDPKVWEAKRRQALKECFQPALAYLTSNVIIFLTREKLVCSRSLEECEHFASAANGRVVSALPPALILVQNCCRPAEGIFDTEQCTAAFIQTHFGNALDWQNYFRSIDCFCIPDEWSVCKRSGFDGEEVCKRVIDSLKFVLNVRLEEDLAFRLQQEVRLSQLQWFSVVSALCRIVNDNDTVKMASLYMRAGATCCGLGDVKGPLLMIMSGKLRCNATVHEQVQVALGLIARFIVRREVSQEACSQLLNYLRGLFPCGAVASKEVESFDRSVKQVVCGQMKLFHNTLHRSNTLVRTVDADWIRGLTEWLRGGITHAWVGEFECHAAFQEYDDHDRLMAYLTEEIEAYKLLKCLEGVSSGVGGPWVVKSHEALQAFSAKIRKDTSQMCVVCTASGEAPGFFTKFWLPAEGNHLPVCRTCYSILEKHDLCGPDAGVDVKIDPCCEACQRRDPWSGVRDPNAAKRYTDHRMFPCRCSVCKACAESVIPEEFPDCPACGEPLRWMVDERALVKSTWAAAVRSSIRSQDMTACTNFCIGNR